MCISGIVEKQPFECFVYALGNSLAITTRYATARILSQTVASLMSRLYTRDRMLEIVEVLRLAPFTHRLGMLVEIPREIHHRYTLSFSVVCTSIQQEVALRCTQILFD